MAGALGKIETECRLPETEKTALRPLLFFCFCSAALLINIATKTNKTTTTNKTKKQTKPQNNKTKRKQNQVARLDRKWPKKKQRLFVFRFFCPSDLQQRTNKKKNCRE